MNYKKIYPLIFVTLFCLIPYLINGRSNVIPEAQNKQEFSVKLYRHESKNIEEIPLKEYLCSVVSAEMQANFAPEALKAQAVAACTYTLYRYEYAKNNPDADNGHPGAYVCDDYAHCKSFLSPEDAKDRWGKEWYEKYYPNIVSAVNQVYGQVITYEGNVINAVFHAISSGTTEPAENVWGSKVPYLVSVDSTLDTTAKDYETIVSFSAKEVKEKLASISISVEGDATTWFSKTTLGSAGSVASVQIGIKTLSGTEIRSLFGLRSTAFSVSATSQQITFTVHGYGHQVGMSQNGANELAKQGKNYTEILKHYYKGVEIQSYNF